MAMDVTYWLNKVCADEGNNVFTLNTAVEATTLTGRIGGMRLAII